MFHLKVATHPLGLSEIRTHIAGFLSNNDCLSCMRVSRRWHMDFAVPIWHTVDFDNDESFAKVPPEVVSKYGHLIRNVLKVAKEEHILFLQNPNIASVQQLQFFPTMSKLSLVLFHDLVRYYRKSLTALEVSGELVHTATYDEQRNAGVHLLLDAIAPGCVLTKLVLTEVCMTHRAFSSVLKFCPRLQSLKLLDVIFLAYNWMLEEFRHTNLKTLVAARYQVWSNGEGMLSGATSLLVHFPSLETWEMLESPVESRKLLSELKASLSERCPRLKAVKFTAIEQNRVASYLDYGFYGLEKVTFDYTALNQTVLLGLLEHQATLTSIILTPSAARIEPSTSDEVPTSKKVIRLVLKSCACLEILSVEGHQMSVDLLEDEIVACMDLQELRVRFCGLETAVLVDECLETLSEKKRDNAGAVDAPSKGGASIGERVCYQLMQFKELKTVWLGTREYYLPTQ
ncbi:hypothetical protein EC957_006689 [Mortierella hygrophila]|uniref:F-box domain-containing protein n=1 Tax=Mortierella hygrophila TaxID=979708 RepID=A0A9P6EZL2_9FUNG|nr:hypothetical protein EC957_006689 [Mortierella hygrophila]